MITPSVYDFRYRPPDVLLGSTEYSTSLDIWATGCIFLEMIYGYPCFTSESEDIFEQMDKIFRVLGTPTEESWPGVSQLPNYSPCKKSVYTGRKFGHAWPRLFDIPYAEKLASMLLQLRAQERISANEAIKHPYFSDLPYALYELRDHRSIFSVPGITFNHSWR